MRWLFMIDGLGVILAAAFAGIAFGGGYVPLAAMVAGVIFMAGLFVPFFLEYSQVGRDFGDIGGDFLKETRRPYFPESGQAEIFGADDRRPGWHRMKEPKVVVGVLTLVALLFFATDLGRYTIHRVETEAQRTTITNF
jgi:hypothetical protein